MADDTSSPTDSTSRRLILDSAFVLAGLSAVCFAMGHQVRLRDGGELGIPAHLLPDQSPQTVAVVGSLYLFLATLVCLLLFCLMALIATFCPSAWRSRALDTAGTRYSRHPKVYQLLILLSAVVFLQLFVWSVPLGHWLYSDDQLPLVKKLQLKGDQIDFKDGELVYVSTRDDRVVLKWVGRKEFLILRGKDVLRLDFLSRDDNGARGIGHRSQ